MLKREYKSGAHTKHKLMYHIILTPKYRKKVLAKEVKKRLEELFRECAEENEWDIHEMNIQKDHVHLLLQFGPTVSVCEVVKILKGGSSRKIREEFPGLRVFLWGDNFWATGYFAETVGKVNEDCIRRYIKNQ